MSSAGQSVEKYFSRYSRSRACLHPPQTKFQCAPLAAVSVTYFICFLGVVMSQALPRQMFGLVQSRLFPKYFMAGVGLSSVTLATYIAQHPVRSWAGNTRTEVCDPAILNRKYQGDFKISLT